MTKLLEIREKFRNFYGKYEIYIRPAIRFLIALVSFLLINGTIGYQSRLKHPAVALVLALLCTFLPANATVVLVAVMILAHLSALSIEACIVMLLLFLLMFLLYFKFVPKDGPVALLTPVLSYFHLGPVMPTAVGLTRQPYSILSMACGLALYYYLQGIRQNERLFAESDDNSGVSKFTIAMQQIVQNKALLVALAGFVVGGLLVYVIRRRAAAHAWTKAIVAGTLTNALILLVGSVLIKDTAGIPWILVGTAASLLVGFVLELFLFQVDYARTEQVQFEDDEYYYYVKAIPKICMSGKDKQVKQFGGGDSISKKQLADEFEIDQELLDE